MIVQRKHWNWTRLAIWCMSGAIASINTPASAQLNLTPDTLPGRDVGTRVEALTPSIDQIQGGTRRGNNLFHSFVEFNVREGRGIYFEDPGVRNIISRVTGNDSSDILGRLGVGVPGATGSANLFLINPNGIVFGAGARLDVGGSFVATTADALEFGDRGVFSASNFPTNLELLTISPSAFLFNQLTAQSIQVNAGGFTGSSSYPLYERLYSQGLQVLEARSLILLGGDVIVTGGSLVAPGGRIELAGVSEPATVGLVANSERLHLNLPDFVSRADISLSRSLVNVTAGNDGDILVAGRNINLLSNSELRAGIGDGQGSINAQAGDITLDATGTMNIARSSIVNQVGDYLLADSGLPTLGAVGQGGNINIQANSLFLRDNAQVFTNTAERGDAGDISIRVDDSVSLVLSSISSNVEAAIGDAGDISIEANSFSLRNFSFLFNDTSGQGNSGNISIQVRDSVYVRGSNILAEVLSTGVGQGGNIRIESENGSISFLGGSSLGASTFGQGDAGSIFIRADDSVSIISSAVQTAVESGAPGVPGSRAVGNGGDIVIQAESLTLTGELLSGGFESILRTNTNAQGNAGDLIIQVDDFISLSSSVLSTGVEPRGVGRGGDIHIHAESLTLDDGSLLNTRIQGQGRGGDVWIDVSDVVQLVGVSPEGAISEIASSTESGAIGRAGDITIHGSDLRLSEGAVINARTLSGDRGGDITINADSLEATNGGQIVTSSLSGGRAGNIDLNISDRAIFAGTDTTYFDRLAEFGEIASVSPASGVFANTSDASTAQGGSLSMTVRRLLLQDGAEVTVSSQGRGSAGDLTILASSVSLDNEARIIAETAFGEGGDINLQDIDLLLLRRDSQISATAGIQQGGGNGGDINVDSDLIVAIPTEDSDIAANAFEGSGGNIDITTQGIFGIEFRESQTLLSDITVSSEFGIDGEVSINRPDVDPSRGLAELPDGVIDASNQIAQACPPTGGQVATDQQSEFVVTGRGGLPPSPSEVVSGDAIQVDLVTPYSESEYQVGNIQLEDLREARTPSLVEAQGWTVGTRGEIILTAMVPTVTPQHSWQNSAGC
ncbi:S-layer family protein [Cyanobacteria bacterium FACHB-471]|nr:S-layer family protein [Cyanobacteria bacterium FACHB-471]